MAAEFADAQDCGNCVAVDEIPGLKNETRGTRTRLWEFRELTFCALLLRRASRGGAFLPECWTGRA